MTLIEASRRQKTQKATVTSDKPENWKNKVNNIRTETDFYKCTAANPI